MKIELIIDRFEGEFAVCEQQDRTMLNIKRSSLPRSAKEGDVLVCEEQAGEKYFSIDIIKTQQLRLEMADLD